MSPIILPDVTLLANTWTLVVLPDKCRESIRIQAKSLSILEYSFDAGLSFMQTVGAGDQLLGNYSGKSLWFRVGSADIVKIMVQDKLY